MSDHDTDDLDQEHRQQTQGQQPGGRATRGPSVNSGGEQEPGGLVPPYEGRSSSGDAPETDDSVRHPSPDSTAGDEQPASDYGGGEPVQDGTGPAHVKGVSTGETQALGKDEEERRKQREDAGVMPSKPIDPEMPGSAPADSC
jgi:hypothetical protein